MSEETAAEVSSKRRIKVPFKLAVKVLPILVIALISAGGMYYLARNKPEVLGLAKNAEQVQAETRNLIEEVGMLMTLPSDENPTIATVSDVEKVKSQNFFRNAANGDRLLIYANSRKAILYRPSEKKIIEVGAVNINQATPGPSTSPAPQTSATPAAEETVDTP
jgi:hypothetical protein